MNAFERITEALADLRDAADDMDGCTDAETLLEHLCRVCDAETAIREACAYLQGYAAACIDHTREVT